MKVKLLQRKPFEPEVEGKDVHLIEINLEDGQKFVLKVHDNLLEVVAANGFMLIQPRGSNLVLLESVE